LGSGAVLGCVSESPDNTQGRGKNSWVHVCGYEQRDDVYILKFQPPSYRYNVVVGVDFGLPISQSRRRSQWRYLSAALVRHVSIPTSGVGHVS
jgi:hypothetical protein